MTLRDAALPAFMLLLSSLPVRAEATPTPETSILRVNVTNQPYNFALPWQKRQPGTRQGLGALLEGNKVLVTAELVQDATYLEFEVASTGRKLTAKAQTIDYEANLALLAPAEEPDGFFDGLVPFTLSNTPPQKGDKFEVWQFENNGSSVTTEITFESAQLGRYFVDGSYFLQFEANGAVNYRAGSFTLPVIHSKKLTGMLLTYDKENQVAAILPYPIIKAFLDDAADGNYVGFPSFGIQFAPTLDQQLRTYLKLDPSLNGGILITGVMPGTSAAAAGLKEGDVLLEIGGYKLDTRGYYQDPTWGLIALGHLVKGGNVTGAQLPMKISREGQILDLTLTLLRKKPSDYLVDPYIFDRAPKYLILGGMVFSELSKPYLEAFGHEWRQRAPFEFVYAAENQQEFEREGRRKLVFLVGTLPSESTLGYENIRGVFVEKVNDQFIGDLKDFNAALANPIDGRHKIEISSTPYTIYLDASLVERDNQIFLPQRYRIHEMKQLD